MAPENTAMIAQQRCGPGFYLATPIQALQAVPGLRLIGAAPERTSVLSFVLDGYRPDDVGTALD